MSLLAVAHRAGNSLAGLRSAVEVGADVVEADVHVAAGRLEVRHSKALGPLPWLWDRRPWELTPTSVPQLELPALLGALPSSTGLMLDLKGAGPVGVRAAEAVHGALPDRPVLVCSRWWPSLAPFATAGWARPVLSCRNRAELVRLRRRVRGVRVPYGVSLHGSLLSAAVVTELRQRVELVMTWGVDDLPTLEQVLSLGVNGVISNDADVLRAVAARRTGQHRDSGSPDPRPPGGLPASATDGPCARGACTPASSRVDADPRGAPPGSAGCAVPGSPASSRPRPSR